MQYLVVDSLCVRTVSSGTSHVHCVWWYIMCAVSGGTRRVHAQCLVVCAVSCSTNYVCTQCCVWWCKACACSVWWCVQCPVVQIMCARTVLCLVEQGMCVHSVWWCVQCPVVQIVRTHACAVSGGTLFVCAKCTLLQCVCACFVAEGVQCQVMQGMCAVCRVWRQILYKVGLAITNIRIGIRITHA